MPLLLVLPLLLLCGCASGLTATERGAAAEQRRYRLPYAAGTSHLVVQAGPGPFSHKGRERHAVDFKMATGTRVLAARSGRVVQVKEDSNIGGSSRSYAPHGNRILVDHGDGSRAVYLHLMKDGALVDEGQLVRQGEVIGRSGDTGWSAMPHLHFHVERLRDGAWASIPVAFEDVGGDGIPRWLRHYRSGNRSPTPQESR